MRRGRLSSLPKRLLNDQRGVSAIEFALIAPVMILIYFGLVVFSQAYMAERRASHVASIVADLIAQSDGTSRKDLDSTFWVGDIIMQPFAPAQLSIRASSVTVNSRGVATVQWSRANGRNMAQRKRDSQIDNLPPDLISAGETVILGETEYRYKLFIPGALSRDITFRRRYFLLPRTANQIACPDC
ncbi:TadE/TadG family type IV pilus assembly protein [Brevundimonas diminuta]|uniref:TadE/TadG family type IV pilus assembly protein n=1 Tax=Brevundimonas diminuta TaxID=293 RepID=UPI003D004746